VGRPDPFAPGWRVGRGAPGLPGSGGVAIELVERIFREEWGRTVAALAHATGDLALAEDALQDAFETALGRWGDGIPRNPGGWIMATARNRAVDRIRRDRTLVRKAELLGRLEALPPATDEEADDEMTAIPDERLGLIFACCHPALSVEAQVALTLRTLGG